jgi:hypothetical protein
MMARNSNVPLKGRIQKRKTHDLQIVTFGLQRAAGPYRWAMCRHGDVRAQELIRAVVESDQSPWFGAARHFGSLRGCRDLCRLSPKSG